MPVEITDQEGLVLSRYLLGESSAAEAAKVAQWIASSGERQKFVEELRQTLAMVPRSTKTWDIRAAWRRTVARRANNTRIPDYAGEYLPLRGPWRWAVLAASVVSVIAVIALVNAMRLASHTLPSQVYATAPGQRLQLTLSDGTQILLAPESRLQLAHHYATDDRRVDLTGEAYFTVAHDDQHPFTVHAGALSARDVGTAFDVLAYPENASTRVAVAEGIVNVRGEQCRALGDACQAEIHGRDVATVLADGSITTRRNINVDPLFYWRQNGFSFEDTPLRDVIRQIGRTFDVKITLADTALRDKPVTATFAGDSLDFVLNAVTGIVGAAYERHGRTIVIRRSVMRGDKHVPGAPVLHLTQTGLAHA